MSSVKFEFRGLMAPVFTAFQNDELRSINYDIIDVYAKQLKKAQIHGVLVNGTSGEGMSLTVAERKLVTEKWSTACKKYDITLMVQIGGAALTNVLELAEHSEKLGVDAILCLPELYFKPTTEEALVEYFQVISKHCKNTPLLYYHFPAKTNVNLNMPRFISLAEKSVPNFVGIKYTSGNLDEGSACLKEGRAIFLGADTILCGALAMGFDSTIMTSLNICPELSVKIMESMKRSEIVDARSTQKQLNARIAEILKNGDDWVTAMKNEFNKSNAINVSTQGPVRKPL